MAYKNKTTNMNTKEVIHFSKTIAAGATDTLNARIKNNGTLEEIRVRFYEGANKELAIRPVIDTRGNLQEIFSYATSGDSSIKGNDDYFVLPVNMPVKLDDVAKVMVVSSSLIDLDFVVDFVIDYKAGLERAVR
ncbi:MAG: hypothetical protein JJE29_00430 [Peptostreptococcaceae bacterium]|nr:hypothetical protein [Peptostreptococcaceae bacterium]